MFVRTIFTAILVFFFVDNVFAQNACDVNLSFIKGSAETQQTEKFDSNVLEQLKELPFSSYRLLKKENKNVGLNQVAEFVLTNDKGESKVEVTPIIVEGPRIQTLIAWTSSTGENILSSKMWFDNGKSLVFGAEQGNTRCTVLEISVKCQN